MKADKEAYLKLSGKLDSADFDALSIEDAHRRNDPQLFKVFKKKKVNSAWNFWKLAVYIHLKKIQSDFVGRSMELFYV